jgi:hypothetical protein
LDIVLACKLSSHNIKKAILETAIMHRLRSFNQSIGTAVLNKDSNVKRWSAFTYSLPKSRLKPADAFAKLQSTLLHD